MPSVKAYRGPLPNGQRGIEFFTVAGPSGMHPEDVFWFAGETDVWTVKHDGDDFALVVAEVTLVRY